MKKIFGFALVLIPSILSADYCAEQYFCVADSSVGFSFQPLSNKWIANGFNIEDKKYIISASPEKGYEYQVTKLGEYRVSLCKNRFNEHGFLLCSIPMKDVSFKFNKKNGRYMLSYSKGYYNVVSGFVPGSDDESDTPYLEIGKCSSLNSCPTDK